ncbi:MAG: hypothetical protein A2066_12965 [Bacteroidetes bacterium GWB2_41_8]|nr:MAG: hypothetical protein A2066_12965 [Bacteroidetes bacterium GWB2_41_8]
MTVTERQIFRLKDEIQVSKWHMNFEENPTKYSLPKTTEERQRDIELLKNRIIEKQNELEQLETRNLKPETQLS